MIGQNFDMVATQISYSISRVSRVTILVKNPGFQGFDSVRNPGF